MDQLLNQPIEQPRSPLIFIVDDDSSLRLLLRVILEKEGYTIIEAEDGFQALSAFERLQPDLILLDAMMPLMDGFTTCTSLRKLPEGESIPILMVTALKDDDAINRAYEAGATDYLIKPVHQTVLRHKVQHLLRAKQAEDTLRHVERFYREIQTLGHDIAELKQTEERLRQKLRSLEATLETFPKSFLSKKNR